MRILRFNEAEAIIEPFWAGDKNPDGSRWEPLAAYTITWADGASGDVYPDGRVTIRRAVAGRPAVTLTRRCDLDLADFDRLRLSAMLPAAVRVEIAGELDGMEQILLEIPQGTDTFDEFTAPLGGRRLTALRFAIIPQVEGSIALTLSWLGVAAAEREAEMRARPTPFTPDWPGLLVADPATVTPGLGIFFSADELPALRTRLARPPYARHLANLLVQADADLSRVPEDSIGDYLCNGDPRFVRPRDRRRSSFLGTMERLAFCGLVAGRPAMSRLAARMALSVVHCRSWVQGPIVDSPASIFHPRAFVEAWMCKSLALTLDWAGDYLTPAAQELIRDRMIHRGLARIESDLMRWDYVWGMNQGLMFNHGRLFALLALTPTYPRYGARLAEAERDQFVMLESYLKEDGGCLEGMGYWLHTLQVALLPMVALARRQGVSLEAYAGARVRRSAAFGVAMLSHVGDGRTYLPINDCGCQVRVDPFTASVCAEITGDARWQQLATAAWENEAAADIFALLFHPEEHQAAATPAACPLYAFPVVGQAGVTRIVPGVGEVRLHLVSGPSRGGHSHEDKGSIILEAAGETLACDRGTLPYDHPEHVRMAWAESHNLLCPLDEDGTYLHQAPHETDGGQLTEAIADGDEIRLTSEQATAWPSGLCRRHQRRIVSPSPDRFLIEDDVELATARPVVFLLHSPLPIVCDAGGYLMRGVHAWLRVTPIDWTPESVELAPHGVDGLGRPVWRLALRARSAGGHRLGTWLEVGAVGDDVGRESD
jgi:hypothetical protein